jgi:hypothetical protein
MKKIVPISLFCFLLTGFISRSDGQTLTTAQKSGIATEVASVFHEMIKAGENLDYEKLSSGVDDRQNAGFILNGSYFAAYDSLVNILKANRQDGARQTITIQKEKITVLSDSIVLITAYGDSKVMLNPGQTFTARFLWSFVYEKTNNNWKVIQSHQSRAN